MLRLFVRFLGPLTLRADAWKGFRARSFLIGQSKAIIDLVAIPYYIPHIRSKGYSIP